jgi:hypothetical protein
MRDEKLSGKPWLAGSGRSVFLQAERRYPGLNTGYNIIR